MKIKSLLILALFVAMGQATWAQTQPIDLSTEPFTEGFENDLGDWTVIPGVSSSAMIDASIGHGSSHSFHFFMGASYTYLVSPMFTGTENGINLQFYYTNYWDGSSYFKVGYSTTTNDIDDFIWGDLIVADQGNMHLKRGQGWTLYDHDLPSSVKYVAIAYYKNGSHHLYVDDFNITLLEGCAMPSLTDVNGSNNTIALNWLGNSESYELRYKQLAFSDFEDGMEPWSAIDADGDGYNWMWGYNSTSSQGELYVYSQSYHNPQQQGDDGSLTPDNYLVSPLMQLGGSISFYARAHDAIYHEEHFGIAVSTVAEPTATDFTTIAEWDAESDDWTYYTVDLSAYSGLGHVAIRHFGCTDQMSLDVDNITLFNPNDEWIVIPLTETTYTLDNLMHETAYGIQLRGVCGGNQYSSWSDLATVITDPNPNAYRFVYAGAWNDGTNWENGEVPADGSDVTIAANAIIPADYTAIIGSIAMKYGITLTIEEGGQLKHNTVGVQAIVKKSITPYENVDGNDHYYLLASPMANEVNVASNTNLIANDSYDLYSFDQNEELEWRNYNIVANEFTTLANKAGYLYANGQGMTATIAGQLMRSNDDVEVALDYNNAADLKGWNLLGNPFACNAYLGSGQAFYKMNSNGTALKTVTGGAIDPMQGFFVQATAANQNAIISRNQPITKNGQINMNLYNRNQELDNAILVFGNGCNLGKFSFRENSSKVYISSEGEDYAALFTTDQMGEMPVSFKAEENGNFTLSFINEDVEFGYLHLIDNLTGNDVDLLQNPNYSFEAKTTDYASRFTLVFAKGNNTEDNFAFFSNNRFVISNEGEATLQVVDVMGRIIKSETLNGSASVNLDAAPGVYMLRLVNGNNIKVQKVMVR